MSEKLFYSLTLAYQMDLRAINHHFGRTRSGIVVRTHGHAIGAGGHDGKQVAGFDRQWAATAEEIARLAYRADDVPIAGASWRGDTGTMSCQAS